jgi:hypothetical protein
VSFRLAATASLFLLSHCVPAERQPGESKPRDRPKTIQAPTAELIVTGESEAGSGASEGSNDRPDALPVLTKTFKDDFERRAIGDDYLATGNQYRIEAGRLCVKGARNHPLWLRHRLPLNARIEVEAETPSPDGDIKLEAWGDGQAAATRISYTNATSYLAIFGGWKNRYHVLARMDEHAPDRPEIVIEPGSDDARRQPVQQNRRYRLKLERTDGKTVRFWVDDVEMLSFTDPMPLAAGGHEHFAFNNWETPVCFDQLVVEPLPG